MKTVTRYPDGIFCWTDLATTDAAAAKKFYMNLFGWDVVETPTDDSGGTYNNMHIAGQKIAGMGQLPPDMQAQGVPSNWTCYIKHDDLDGVTEKVMAAGGTVMLPTMEIMEEGRMAMFQDPSGAVFGVWEPRNHIGAQLVNSPNTVVWNELQTRDGDAAEKFYTQVFDWGTGTDDNGYVLFKQGERVHAGMVIMNENFPDGIPPNWMVYFQVDDIETATAKAEELGGNIMVANMEAGELGRFSVVQDPTGAVFTIMQFNGPTDDAPVYQ